MELSDLFWGQFPANGKFDVRGDSKPVPVLPASRPHRRRLTDEFGECPSRLFENMQPVDILGTLGGRGLVRPRRTCLTADVMWRSEGRCFQ